MRIVVIGAGFAGCLMVRDRSCGFGLTTCNGLEAAAVPRDHVFKQCPLTR